MAPLIKVDDVGPTREVACYATLVLARKSNERVKERQRKGERGGGRARE